MLGDSARGFSEGSSSGFKWDKDLKAWTVEVAAVLHYTTDADGGTVTADDIDEEFVR